MIDLHIHSNYSFDSNLTPSTILQIAKEKKLRGIAITDHNSIKASIIAKKLNKDKEFIVIIGEEVRSIDGDILALGIKKKIPSDLPTNEVIKRIHKHNGIAIVAHPFSFYHGSSAINKESIIKNNNFDGIEVLNSKVRKKDCLRAEKLANKLKIVKTGGSDAHIPETIGIAGVEVEGSTQEDIIENIRNGKVKVVGNQYGKKQYVRHLFRRII